MRCIASQVPEKSQFTSIGCALGVKISSIMQRTGGFCGYFLFSCIYLELKVKIIPCCKSTLNREDGCRTNHFGIAGHVLVFHKWSLCCLFTRSSCSACSPLAALFFSSPPAFVARSASLASKSHRGQVPPWRHAVCSGRRRRPEMGGILSKLKSFVHDRWNQTFLENWAFPKGLRASF